MNMVKYIIANIIETLLRVIPFPCKTGLIKIGNPKRNSPVFLTGNYHLTVERVKRALRGMDAYLLVAKSRGMDVWCAAAGGNLTNHDVISVLKTSGIEELEDNRKVILPQLAAPGIESKVVHKETGWKVIWGPVYARDIPAFVENSFNKTPNMREVRFKFTERIEMATMWAFPFSVIAALITIPFWRDMFLPVTGLIWSLTFLIFLCFPLYSKLLNPKKKGSSFSKYTIIFDLSRTVLILWGFFVLCLVVYGFLTQTFRLGFVFRWSIISFIVVSILNIDLMGSTPVYKSGLHEDRFLKVVLDTEKCRGVGFCRQVCPRYCFELVRNRQMAKILRPERCVQCGACIVQCPFDAVHFEGRKGEIILPEVIRRSKLSLVGKRLLSTKTK